MLKNIKNFANEFPGETVIGSLMIIGIITTVVCTAAVTIADKKVLQNRIELRKQLQDNLDTYIKVCSQEQDAKKIDPE
jgi:hypothetical protein